MIRTQSLDDKCLKSIPRESGDDPSRVGVIDNLMEYSPRERG